MDTDELADVETVETMEAEDGSDEESAGEAKVFLPGTKLEKGEVLECDESAYVMLHQAHAGAPCLSFDIIQGEKSASQTEFPMETYLVAGTQAAASNTNSLIVMRMSNLHRTSKERDSDMESDSDSDEEEIDEEKKPKMSCSLIKHMGCINRVRSTNFNNSTFVASWSELGVVNIFNIQKEVSALSRDDPKSSGNSNSQPVFSFNGHQKEGFALDWSSAMKGYLATGDCLKNIHIWKPSETSWIVNQVPLLGHQQSVEDIQWSPNESNVLASCSVDKSIRIWDIRAAPSKACMLTCEDAHQSDVNVMNWNRNEPLLLSGGDDGVLQIWDLRYFSNKTPVGTFKHHTDHITTVEWHPTDSTVFASGGNDDQIALWDLSVEADDSQENVSNLPPQLLFIHQGQSEIKELHWHPNLPGVILSTANSGFNVFKTISV